MNRKNVLTTLFIAIILLSLVTLTYAFFVAGEISSTDQTATVETGTMALM